MTTEEALLREKLSQLTIKRHAVLTATLGKRTYQQIAEIMQCDVTTIKLHLKAALTILGISTRDLLLVSHSQILDCIPDKEYESEYGLSKQWWQTQPQALMEVLRATKPAANQYTKDDQ